MHSTRPSLRLYVSIAALAFAAASSGALVGPERAAADDPVPVYRGQVLPFSVGLGDVDDIFDARGNCGNPGGGPILYDWRVSFPADKASPSEGHGETFSFSVTADFDPGFIWPVDITVIGTCGLMSAFSGNKHLGNFVVQSGAPPPTGGDPLPPLPGVPDIPDALPTCPTHGAATAFASVDDCGDKNALLAILDRYANVPWWECLDPANREAFCLRLRADLARAGLDLVQAILDFLILDDIRVLADPNGDVAQKVFILASWLVPVPGGRLLAKLGGRLAGPLATKFGPRLAALLEKYLAPALQKMASCALGSGARAAAACNKGLKALRTFFDKRTRAQLDFLVNVMRGRGAVGVEAIEKMLKTHGIGAKSVKSGFYESVVETKAQAQRFAESLIKKGKVVAARPNPAKHGQPGSVIVLFKVDKPIGKVSEKLAEKFGIPRETHYVRALVDSAGRVKNLFPDAPVIFHGITTLKGKFKPSLALP